MSTKKNAGRKRGGKKADQERRLTVGDVYRAIKQSNDELKAEYGDRWESVRAEAVKIEAFGIKDITPWYAWAAEWAARLPEMKPTPEPKKGKPPQHPAVFDIADIASMIEGNGKEVPECHLLEWGKMIAEAIREGRASHIRALANYVEKLEKCRPTGKPGIKAPWPDRAEDLRGVKTALSRRRLKLAKAIREMAAAGERPKRSAVAKRAGEKTVGNNYTKAWACPGLAMIFPEKSGVKPAVPTPNCRPKG